MTLLLKRLVLHIFVSMVLLTACGVPEASTPAPTPRAIRVFFPSSLKPYGDKLAACAGGDPLVALYFLPLPAEVDNLTAGDMLLSLGPPEGIDASHYFSQVGTERIIMLVNQDNQIEQLSTEQAESIFSGSVTKWEKGIQKPVQVWVLPPGDAVRRAFDSAVLPSDSPSTHAMLAPHPLAVLEAVAKNESAVGYLPESVLTASDALLSGKVRILSLPPELQAALTLPVIVTTLDEPLGLPRQLLVCLQSSAP